MKKPILQESIAVRLMKLDLLQHELNKALVQTQRYYMDMLKRVNALAAVEGFDVTMTPNYNKDVVLLVVWSCEKRREPIAPQETKEIETMIGNIESVGFRATDVQHDPFFIQAQFRMR